MWYQTSFSCTAKESFHHADSTLYTNLEIVQGTPRMTCIACFSNRGCLQYWFQLCRKWGHSLVLKIVSISHCQVKISFWWAAWTGTILVEPFWWAYSFVKLLTAFGHVVHDDNVGANLHLVEISAVASPWLNCTDSLQVIFFMILSLGNSECMAMRIGARDTHSFRWKAPFCHIFDKTHALEVVKRVLSFRIQTIWNWIILFK